MFRLYFRLVNIYLANFLSGLLCNIRKTTAAVSFPGHHSLLPSIESHLFTNSFDFTSGDNAAKEERAMLGMIVCRIILSQHSTTIVSTSSSSSFHSLSCYAHCLPIQLDCFLRNNINTNIVRVVRVIRMAGVLRHRRCFL